MPEITSKTKILYLITKSNWGGAQRYVFDLATNLPNDQYEILVALGGNGLLKEKLDAQNIKTVEISSLDRDISLFKEIHSLVKIYKIIKEFRPRIIHSNSSKAGGLGSLAARIYNLLLKKHELDSKIKIIYTAHGWAFKEKRKLIFKKLIEYSSWLTILLSDKTIVVSEDDKDKVKDFLFVQKKIEMVHNGIDQIQYKSRNDSRKIISDKIGKTVDKDTFLIGTIAELHKNKGLEYSIGAFGMLYAQNELSAKLKNSYYIIIGSGEEKDNLQNAIVREKLQNHTFLFGHYTNAAELLRAFDLFLIPSLKEGLPYVLLEAGQAGLPIIATSVGGIPEVIEDMKSGAIVREKRSKEIAECISFLFEHENKRKEFAEKISQKIKNEYTLQNMIKETLIVYNSKN